jgi:hypothetical protein
MRMPALRLITKLFLYYTLLVLGTLLALWLFPGLAEHLPAGRVQALLAQPGAFAPLEELARPAPGKAAAGATPSFMSSIIWLAAAIVGALAAALPVSWVYMAIRDPEEYDQSLLDTVLILPLVVTMIVVVVQHSLALAFSLAGIAGAARFRNTMKSSGDLLFILLAIGIGLSAGIGAIELALLGSAAFNLAFLLLWMTSYGERSFMKRYMGGQITPAGAGAGAGAGDGDNGGRHKKHGKRAKAAALAAAAAAGTSDAQPAAADPPPGAPAMPETPPAP